MTCQSMWVAAMQGSCGECWAQAKNATADASSAMLQIKDGKLNGIPIWVWILIALLAILFALTVTGLSFSCRRMLPATTQECPSPVSLSHLSAEH